MCCVSKLYMFYFVQNNQAINKRRRKVDIYARRQSLSQKYENSSTSDETDEQ